jgi:allantoin racemase
MKDILMVLPFVSSSPLIGYCRGVYGDATDVDFVGVEGGRDPLITLADIEFNVPGILQRIIQAEKKGYPAAIVGCFGDPALVAARQLVSIPVLGPGEVSFSLASTLGDRILVVEPCDDFTYATERTVQALGLRHKVVAVRTIKTDVCTNVPSTENAREIADKCLRAVEETRAHVIVMGCIGFSAFVGGIRSAFHQRGVCCPIVEPGITVIEHARMLLRLGLNHSRMMFPKPKALHA